MGLRPLARMMWLPATAAARERENAAQKQAADARQTELKQALDESGARSEALARELASARKNDVAARDLAAALERENAAQKQTAVPSRRT